MEGGESDDELASFWEFYQASNVSDVVAPAQANPLPNDVSLGNMSSIPSQNTNLNLNQVQGQDQDQDQDQDQGLFPHSGNMRVPPNPNYFTEPQVRPHYQLNPELSISQNDFLGNQDQYMARPPFQRGINITSTYSYSGRGNSAAEYMHGNIEGFVRNTRMRVDPDQARTGTVTVSPSTAQYNVGFPRPNRNPGQQMAIHSLASNTESIPLDGGAVVPRFGMNMPPMQIIRAMAPAPAPASVVAPRVASQSQYIVNEAIPAPLPSSRRQSAQNEAVLAPLMEQPAFETLQRTIFNRQLILGASQIRSQGVSVHQAVPTMPTVFVPGPAGSTLQRGNTGALVLQQRPQFRRFVTPTRNRLTRGSSSTASLEIARNLIRQREQALYLARALRPEASARQFEILQSRVREMLNERREDDRHQDMRLDIDNMSYEELLYLEDQIGGVSTGVSEVVVNERMKQRTFSALLENEAEPCCICQEEYVENEEVGTLDCGHNFHSACIRKWLGYKNICPICKMPGIKT